MRRISTTPRILTANGSLTKKAELAFLLQTPPKPNTRHPHSGDGNENGQPKASGLSTTVAMQRLSNAVRHKKYSLAEQLFKLAPGLGQRQAALRLLVKMYCEQRDFTTAKAVLFASLDKVGDRGVARYMAHCTFGSQNSADIEEVYERWCTRSEPSAQVAEMALLGTRFLGDPDAFKRVWRRTSDFWEPSLKAPTLMAKVLDLLLNEDWESAYKVWRIAAGMGSFAQVRPLQVFYIACRFFLVETPNVEAVNAILQLMRRLQLKLTPQFTALLLRHLVPMFPETPVEDWIGAAEQRDWPLSDQCVQVLLRAHSKRFDSTPWLAHALYRHALQQMRVNGCVLGPHPLAESPHGGSDLRALQNCKRDAQVFEVLEDMLKRGLQIPYYYFVVAFRLLTDWGSDRLPDLISLIGEQGYPLHCSGIDLAVVEMQCREARYNILACKEMVAEYLVQYPLIGHNRSQLTQLGLIMWRAGDFRTAQMLVDSIRAEQSEHQRYTGANHDSASLQLLLRCRLSMGEDLTSFMRSVLSDRPSIYFDNQFLSSLDEMLSYRSEDRSVLAEVHEHNAALKQKSYSEIDTLIAKTRHAIANQNREADENDGSSAGSPV